MNVIDARVALCVLAARESGEHVYIWGGESAGDEGGFDCSGFVCDLLTRFERLCPGIYSGGRTTAHGLYSYYRARGCSKITEVSDLVPGSLVFYRRSARSRIYHVALHVANLGELVTPKGRALTIGPISIESGGAGSSSKSPREALKRSAGVRMSASDYHGGAVWIAFDPFENEETEHG